MKRSSVKRGFAPLELPVVLLILVLIGLGVVLFVRILSGQPVAWYWWIVGGATPIALLLACIAGAVWVEKRQEHETGRAPSTANTSPLYRAGDFSQEKLEAKGTPICPHCGKRLRTDLAQQCLECGADWHGGS